MTTGFRPGTRWHESAQSESFDADRFDSHFRKEITPHFDALEQRRIKLKNQYTWRLAIAAAGTVCLLLITIIMRMLMRGPDGGHMIDMEVLIIVPLLAGVGLVIWAQGPRKGYVRSYKETLLPAIAKFFGHFAYDAAGGIRMNHLKESTLIPSHDTYHHEDMFTGSYRDVDVEFCEARLTERRGSGKNRRTVTVFAGVFVLMTMNKNFKGMTVVRRDSGKLGNWFRDQFTSLTSRREPVKLEDPTFEKQFEVYSDDQVEARYLLTPAFMTRLMQLSEALGTDDLEAAFFGKQLMIKLPTPKARSGTTLSLGNFNMQLGGGGLFEPGSIFTSAHKISDLNRIVEEFKSILSIVDILKLHESTRL